MKKYITTLNGNSVSSKSGLCLRTELVKILNIQKISDFLSLKFPEKTGGNSRWVKE